MLEIKNLSYKYPREYNEVLNDISFSLQEGRIGVLLGPNGCGKSTLLRCIASLLSYKTGTIEYDSKKLNELSFLKRAELVGFVNQETPSTSLSVYDTVMLGRIRYGKKDREVNHRVVEETIQRIGIEDIAFKNVNELSGGQRQLTMIARCLAQEPKILLLDEPTSSLDLFNQNLVMKTIRKITDEEKLTVLVSMHDINLSLRYGDIFYLMNGHRIISEQKKDDLDVSLFEKTFGVGLEKVVNDRSIYMFPKEKTE